MKNSTIAGGVVVAGLAAAAYFGLPVYFNDLLKQNLDGWVAAQPEGKTVTYSGLKYDFWAGRISAQTAEMAWQPKLLLENPEAVKNAPEKVTLKIKDLVLEDPSILLLIFPPEGQEELIGSMKWGATDLSVEDLNVLSAEQVIANGLFADLSAQQNTETGEMPDLEWKIGAATITGLASDLDLTQFEEGPAKVKMTMGPLTIKDLTAEMIGQLSLTDLDLDFSTETSRGQPISGEVNVASLATESFAIGMDLSQPLAPSAEHQEKWLLQMDVLQLLLQLQREVKKGSTAFGSYASYEIKDIKGKFSNTDIIGNPQVVDFAVASASAKDVTPLQSTYSEARGISFTSPEFDFKLGAAVSKDLDFTPLQSFLDWAIETGPLGIEAAFQSPDWHKALPEFKIGELVYEDMEFSVAGFDQFKMGEVRIYDLGIDAEKQLTFGTQFNEIRLPIELLDQNAASQAAVLRDLGHDALTVNAKLEIAHSPAQQTLDLTSLDFGTDELADVKITGKLSDFKLVFAPGAPPAPMVSSLDKLKMVISDRDMIKAGLTLMAQENQISFEEAQQQAKMMVGLFGMQGKQPATINFFNGVQSLLEQSGKLELDANPASPVPVMQLVNALQQAGPDGLTGLLGLTTTHKSE